MHKMIIYGVLVTLLAVAGFGQSKSEPSPAQKSGQAKKKNKSAEPSQPTMQPDATNENGQMDQDGRKGKKPLKTRGTADPESEKKSDERTPPKKNP